MSSEANHPPASPGVQLAAIGQRFGAVTALAEINLTIEPGSCCGLIGSSGSGKTSLLRIVAGLDAPTSGSLRFVERGSHAPVPRPAIGMVFQNLGLWPHLTARQHVACVLPEAGAVGRMRTEQLLAEVQLPPPSWDRRPGQLSGGEGQRLALARALACNPRLLLLDEPLAHLDAVLREELLQQITRVVRERSLTSVYVTHAWSEASAMCHTIGVLDSGRMQQLGTPQELYWQPANTLVARLTGPLVVVPRRWLVEGKIAADASPSDISLISDDRDALWLRPQQLQVVSAECGNNWSVLDCRPRDSGWQLELKNASDRVTLPAPVAVQPGTHVGIRCAAMTQSDASTPGEPSIARTRS